MAVTRIPLPRLLDASLQEIARLHPSHLEMTESLSPLSTAEMTLPEGEPAVTVGMFMHLFTSGGDAGVYRVASATRLIGPESGQTVSLQHALCTLADGVIPGYLAFGGGTSLRQVMEDLLGRQSRTRWQLGDVPDLTGVAYSWENENLLTALLSVTAPLTDLMWDYDFSTVPWTLSLIPLPHGEHGELRASRSLTQARVTIDRADLCTRIYPLGFGEGADQLNIRSVNGGVRFLSADTVDTWGVVKRIWVDPSITSAATLKAAAQAMLQRTKDPIVTVEADARELCAVTGESVDRFRLGHLARLPLPEQGVLMDERIILLHRPDVYGDPLQVTVTLANRPATAVDDLSRLSQQTAVSLQYSQGAPSQSSLHVSDNCDDTHPARLRFYIDEDVENVNHARVVFSLESFRGCSSVLPSSVSGANTHTHAMTYGIVESGGAASVSVSVDGAALPDSVTSSGAFDAAAYLSQGADGRVLRGTWHEIAFTPDAPARVTADLHLRTFIRSLSGANL